MNRFVFRGAHARWQRDSQPNLNRALLAVPLLLVGCFARSGEIPGGSKAPETRAVSKSDFELKSNLLRLPTDGKPPMAAVLLFPPIQGRAAVEDLATLLTERGYAVIALDPFAGLAPQNVDGAEDLYAKRIRALYREGYDQLDLDSRIQTKNRYLIGWSEGAIWASRAQRALAGVTGLVLIHPRSSLFDEAPPGGFSVPTLLLASTSERPAALFGLERSTQTLYPRTNNVHHLTFEVFDNLPGFMDRNDPEYSRNAARIATLRLVLFLDEHRQESATWEAAHFRKTRFPDPLEESAPDWFTLEPKVALREWLQERRVVAWVDAKGRVAQADTECAAMRVGGSEGLVCRSSSTWHVWQVRERRMCLVFSARRESYWLKSDFRASSDGSAIFLCQPNCNSAFEQAKEKRELFSLKQWDSMRDVCIGVGRWSWTGTTYRRDCEMQECLNVLWDCWRGSSSHP
jgi:dienelactone hydrolase